MSEEREEEKELERDRGREIWIAGMMKWQRLRKLDRHQRKSDTDTGGFQHFSPPLLLQKQRQI